jgi:hypothetical protein
MKLPRTVIALDYGSKGDLYIRFKQADKPMGEPMKDGLAVFFYDEKSDLIAVEISDVSRFT